MGEQTTTLTVTLAIISYNNSYKLNQTDPSQNVDRLNVLLNVFHKRKAAVTHQELFRPGSGTIYRDGLITTFDCPA